MFKIHVHRAGGRRSCCSSFFRTTKPVIDKRDFSGVITHLLLLIDVLRLQLPTFNNFVALNPTPPNTLAHFSGRYCQPMTCIHCNHACCIRWRAQNWRV